MANLYDDEPEQPADPAILQPGDPRLSDAAWQAQNRDKMRAHAAAKLRLLDGGANRAEEPDGDRGIMEADDVRMSSATWQLKHPRAMAAHATRWLARDAAERAKAGLSIAEPTSLLGVDPNKDPAIFLPGRTRR